jgi:hypothetical protein
LEGQAREGTFNTVLGGPQRADTYDYSLIAIMLRRLEMDVDKCITAYNRLIKVVIEEQVHRKPFNLSGDIRPRFDSGKLKKAIEEVIIGQGYSPAAPFNDGKAHGCKVYVSFDADNLLY